jgi:gliding motility-associated-like protein
MKSLTTTSLLCFLLLHCTLLKGNPTLLSVCDDVFLEISVTPAYDVMLACENTPVILQASGSSSNGSYNISWVNQVGQSVLIVTAPGIYTAVITDVLSGCTATASSLIELIDNTPLADAGINSTISCLSPCTVLNATIGGNSNVLDIKWLGPDGYCSNEISPEVCVPGEYILQVHEQTGGCTVFDTVVISEIYDAVSSMHTEALCPGTCIHFADQYFCESGNYELFFESWQGCDSVVHLSVNLINVAANIATPDTLTCLQQQISLNAQSSIIPNGSLYFWTALDTEFSTPPSSLSPLVDSAGTYVLHIQTAETCLLTDTITVHADQKEPQVQAGEDTKIDCIHQVALINGVVDTTLTLFDLNWSGPDNYSSSALENEVLVAGTYSLKVMNLQNGCGNEDQLYVGPQDTVHIELTTEKTCWNEDKGKINIALTNGGTSPYAYSLDGLNFQSDTVFQQLASGNYTIYWKDIHECGSQTDISIPEIAPLSSKLDAFYHICSDTYATLNAAVNINELQSTVHYEWNTGVTTPVLRVNQAGVYSVAISNQCETLIKETKVVNDFIPALENVYVPTAFSPNNDLINDVFLPYIKHDLIHYEIKIFDRRGSLMFATEDIHAGWDGTLKDRNAHSGVYAWWIEYIISTCNGGRARGFLKGDVTLLR